MNPAARIALIVVGVALAFYGLLPLIDSTEAPSWWRSAPGGTRRPPTPIDVTEDPDRMRMSPGTVWGPEPEPRLGHEFVSAAIATVGSALVAYGVWPMARRPRPIPKT